MEAKKFRNKLCSLSLCLSPLDSLITLFFRHSTLTHSRSLLLPSFTSSQFSSSHPQFTHTSPPLDPHSLHSTPHSPCTLIHSLCISFIHWSSLLPRPLPSPLSPPPTNTNSRHSSNLFFSTPMHSHTPEYHPNP